MRRNQSIAGAKIKQLTKNSPPIAQLVEWRTIETLFSLVRRFKSGSADVQ